MHDEEEIEADAILEAIEKVKDWAMERLLADGKSVGAPSDMPSEEPAAEEEEPEIEADIEALKIDAEPKKPTVMKRYSFSKPSVAEEEFPAKKSKVPVRRR